MTRLQCSKCPWKVTTDPHEIPNGYDVERHRALASTIAKPIDLSSLASGELRMMACHETHDAPCVGWMAHQLGPGNNIALRVRAATGRLDTDIELVGDQHPNLEATLPDQQGATDD